MADGASANAPDAPFAPVRFSLTTDGVPIGQFFDVAINSEVEPVELMEQDGNRTLLRKLPGKRNPPTITLKRGKNEDRGIFAWHQSLLDPGQAAQARRDCTLTMFDASGTPLARYFLENAWPAKIEIGALKASGNEIMVETVTLVCDDLQRLTP
ncbi:MAG TPA: phage tail protein [Jiangellaceae bacterium]|jgi:phage tail-like protein